MKKTILILFVVFTSAVAYSQPKIGLTFAPSIASNRVKYKSPTDEDYEKHDNALRFKFGLEADFKIEGESENSGRYYFSTGLIYAPKRMAFTRTVEGQPDEHQAYKAQYLQVPLTLKLFTNEIQPDIKAFFQLGFLAEVKLYSEALEEYDIEWVEKVSQFDASFHFGAGVEYGAGINTIMYASVFYNRGLVNAVSKTNDATVPDDLVAHLDMLGLQVGLKF